jgi:glutamine amidotransferase-like uncharacterized protein
MNRIERMKIQEKKKTRTWLRGRVAAIATEGDMIEWSWHSIFTSSFNACVSNFGNFLGFCDGSSWSTKRFRLTMVLVVDADVCRVGRRRAMGADVGSIGAAESKNESREFSERFDCGGLDSR